MGRHRSLGVLGGLDPVCGHSTLKHNALTSCRLCILGTQSAFVRKFEISLKNDPSQDCSGHACDA